MMLTGERALLRTYLHIADRSPHTPTYERILRQARKLNLAGATVVKGIMGFGPLGVLQASRWSWTEHVPVIVEIADTPKRIGHFVNNVLSELMIGGIATLERASVALYRHRFSEATPDIQVPPPQPPLSTLPVIEPRSNMHITENGVLLRIFVGESDRYEHQCLYQAILYKARELGLAGATVLRGVEGFGAHSVVHKAKLLETSSDLPIIIEIVDTPEKVERLLPHLQTMVNEGMVTMEYVAILTYHGRPVEHETVTPPAGGNS